LDAAWPSLNEYWRRHYVNTVVEVCKKMAEWKGHMLGGVDGKNLTEWYILESGPKDFSPAKLQATCEALGMDCSSFVFYHGDLGPTNIIVEDKPTS
jgi:hypothetical protein